MPYRALLRFSLDFLPVVVLFVAIRKTDFFTAVAFFMIAGAFALLVSWLLERRLALVPIVFSIFVFGFGGATLLLSIPDLFIIADTIFYLGSALIIGLGMVRGKLYLASLFSGTFALTERGWTLLTYRWLCVFVLVGVSNEVVRFMSTPEVWVDFKFYSSIGITLFALYQFRLAKTHRDPVTGTAWGLRKH